jgi:hypothetical protein
MSARRQALDPPLETFSINSSIAEGVARHASGMESGDSATAALIFAKEPDVWRFTYKTIEAAFFWNNRTQACSVGRTTVKHTRSLSNYTVRRASIYLAWWITNVTAPQITSSCSPTTSIGLNLLLAASRKILPSRRLSRFTVKSPSSIATTI